MPTTCPSCGSSDLSFIGELPPSSGFAGKQLKEPVKGTNLYKCKTCYLQFRFPQLSKDQLDRLYREGSDSTWQEGTMERPDWRIARKWIDDEKNALKVLDVGCFDGSFLSACVGRYECYGIEIHPVAVLRAEKSGIRIVGSDFGDLEPGKVGMFDVVLAMDVIEHVEDPLHLLKMLARVTSEGGSVIIATGTADAPSWRFMGSRYWYCTFLEHISFICPDWCEKAARQAGLKLEKLERFSHVETTISHRAKDLGKNMAYKFFPFLFATLRKMGFGGTDVTHREMAKYPPSWISAKDHIIVRFRK